MKPICSYSEVVGSILLLQFKCTLNSVEYYEDVRND